MVGEKRRAFSSDAVNIYLASLPCKVEHIALLEASSRNSLAVGNQGKLNKAIARLKEEAAELGANGILLGGTVVRQPAHLPRVARLDAIALAELMEDCSEQQVAGPH